MNSITMPARNNLKKSRSIRNPNRYVRALLQSQHNLLLDEEKAVEFKGQWRESVFKADYKAALDLEIGIGVGHHFAHYAGVNPDRNLIGIEIKFKPLFLSVERLQQQNSINARGVRYNGSFIHEIFNEDELNDVIVHHPDPWLKRSQQKRRLLQLDFLNTASRLQLKGAHFYFKTDSEDYFHWALNNFTESPYKLVGKTLDLHKSEYAQLNVITQFERIFINKNLPIYFAKFINSKA